MEKKDKFILISILIFGFLLRFVGLGYNPPSLNWDEVSHGYNAYSILKTGMDQWGQRFPIFNFRAYGDYPTTLNLYLTIPFVFLFGLTEFAIRFPHVLLGTASIFGVYFLTFGTTKRKGISLFAAFLAAVNPWYLFTSRFVLQSNLSVFLLIFAAGFFFNREKNKKYLSFSFILLTLSLFAYHTTRIFTPLIVLFTFLIYKREIKNRILYLFLAFIFLLTGLIMSNPNSLARAKYLTIFDQGAINYIETNQNKYGRIISNKLTYALYRVSSNYVTYFSPKFLFFDGGTQYQFSVPKRGVELPYLIAFFYLGIVLSVKKAFESRNYRLLLIWLLLAPIPASITNESYTVLRATTLLPLPEIFSAIGLFAVLDALKKYKKAFLLISVFVILFDLGNYLKVYFTTYRQNYSWSWQYGYKQAVEYINSNYDNYDNILITKKYGEPHEYVLFYSKYDPMKYISDANSIKFGQSGWWWVDHFDKYYFLNDWQVKDLKLESGGLVDCTEKRCLLITSPDNHPTDWKKLDTIDFLDGKPAFEIYGND